MTRRAWSDEEIATLERAVQRAPSVHNSQPWEFGAEHRQARLTLRPELRVERHDPASRDQFVSFGAALANLVLAVRGLGWSADVAFEHDWSATVTAGRRQEPTATELRRCNAIPRRATYRRDFADVPVEHLQREAVLAAASAPGVRPMWVVGPERARELADQLSYAARVYRADSSYQRELSAWTFPQDTPEGPAEEAGMPTGALAERGLAAIGLARSHTRLPTAEALASRVERESVMVLATVFDEPADHVRAGEAMETAWLAATAQGLVASVMTQPLHLSEVRRGIGEHLGVQDVPQVLMRFGYADSVPAPRTPRRANRRGGGAA